MSSERTATFLLPLNQHFADIASRLGVSLPDGSRISVLAEQGLFASAVGLRRDVEQQNRAVGLVHLGTPNDLPLQATSGGVEVPPGDYTLFIHRDGAATVRGLDGGEPIQLAPPGTALLDGGGTFDDGCSTGDPEIIVHYRNCTICISLVCPGAWIRLVGCFEIPFCRSSIVQVFI